jgi:hypothetical protein
MGYLLGDGAPIVCTDIRDHNTVRVSYKSGAVLRAVTDGISQFLVRKEQERRSRIQH